MSACLPDVVIDWLQQSERPDGDATMYDIVRDQPEIAWAAIMQILEHELTENQTAVLAAGPLEDLLAVHGERFIEQVEREARRNPRLRYLLGGVWQNEMTQVVWDRVQKVRTDVW